MSNAINIKLKLIDDLFAEAPEENRCPQIQRDEMGPYCGNN